MLTLGPKPKKGRYVMHYTVQTSERSYRCGTPIDQDRLPVPSRAAFARSSDQGADAEQAQRTAHAVTGCPIAEVQRLDPV